MNWRVYTVRVVLVLFLNLVNKFEFLKIACFVVAGFGLFFPLLPSKGIYMTLERTSVLKNVPSVRNGCCWGQH